MHFGRRAGTIIWITHLIEEQVQIMGEPTAALLMSTAKEGVDLLQVPPTMQGEMVPPGIRNTLVVIREERNDST
jgi:hypothetical protein